MWIRSQDRERLIQPNKLYIEMGGSGCNIINKDSNGYDFLGNYESYTIAMEVLDEIQKSICKYEKNIIGTGIITYIDTLHPVFEMPEK